MKTSPALRRVLALGLALASVSAIAAPDLGRLSDDAARALARHGQISVAQAGPYVAPGTFRIQVSTKLGKPDAVLADGSWLYHQRRVERSDAAGALLVKFANDGRVSSLSLVTRAVATALQRETKPRGQSDLLATK